ncbi:hypothetical protein HPB49_026581 [Dermacentor silvarum]|nr:hypothetical protein HPB49_026581 [Dermacentor silvarum]
MSSDKGDVCFTSNEGLPVTGFVKCTECNHAYHTGKCSGVTEAMLKSKKDSLKESWKCATCSTARLRGGSSKKSSQELDVQTALARIITKLESLGPLSEKVDNIESCIVMMSSKYDEILTVIKRQDQDLKQLHKRVEQIETKSNTADVAELRATVDELERRGRCLNLEIHGLPKTDNEELLSKVKEVAKEISVPELAPSRIGSLHRVPTKKGKEAGVSKQTPVPSCVVHEVQTSLVGKLARCFTRLVLGPTQITLNGLDCDAHMTTKGQTTHFSLSSLQPFPGFC